MAGAQRSVRLAEMQQKTQAYLDKLKAVRSEMVTLSERSEQMRERAFRLQEAKQRQALAREQARQAELDMEEQMLVARHED